MVMSFTYNSFSGLYQWIVEWNERTRVSHTSTYHGWCKIWMLEMPFWQLFVSLLLSLTHQLHFVLNNVCCVCCVCAWRRENGDKGWKWIELYMLCANGMRLPKISCDRVVDSGTIGLCNVQCNRSLAYWIQRKCRSFFFHHFGPAAAAPPPFRPASPPISEVHLL